MLHILPTNCHFSDTLVQYYCTLIINMLYHLQVTSKPVCWQFCWLLWCDLASQMWCLGRFLPLIIGSHMPEDDEKWCLFVTLLEIVDIIFAEVTNIDKAAYLRDLITDHHSRFVQLYPNCSVIPKMHYILHYPRTMIRLVGDVIGFHFFFFHSKSFWLMEWWLLKITCNGMCSPAAILVWVVIVSREVVSFSSEWLIYSDSLLLFRTSNIHVQGVVQGVVHHILNVHVTKKCNRPFAAGVTWPNFS